jgi:DNA polymerase III subunit gamma/tau
MAHQSLYRRYRPGRFAELRGQDHVVRVLRNAVREDRVGHAYLFSGPRGTGKTSSARILAKVLNCAAPEDGEPCGRCASCLAVEAGTSFDVHELDAASNNGVENIRELIERASYTTAGRHKVYILDEVHMLSRAAEAALLKTLEEPPPHVVFVLATTDPQKVSPTIRSRTQHLEFHLLAAEELEAYVRWIAADAGLELTDDAVEAVVRMGAGSARDTLSALDQVVAAGGVTPEQVPLDDLVEGLIEADSGRALAALAVAVQGGRDPRGLAEELIAHLRDGFLSLVAPELVQLPDRRRELVRDQAGRLGLPGTVRAIEVLGEMLVELRHAPDPRVLLDVALVKLTNADADASPTALLARIERLERAQSGGSGAPAGPAAAARAAARPAPAPRPAAAEPPPATSAAGAEAAEPSAAAAPRPPAAGRAKVGSAVTADPAPVASAEPAAAVTRPDSAVDQDAHSAPASGDGPNRDELTLVWADQVLPRLSARAKPVLAAGHWIDTDAGVALAVPNEPHRARSEQHRAELEAALAAHFARPVPVTFVLEPSTPARPRGAGERGARAVPPDPEPEEAVDPAELVDAGPEHDLAPFERVTQAFPGAELMDEG